MNFRKLLILTFLVSISALTFGQDILKGYHHLFTPVKQYSIYHTTSKIKIDGIPNEKDWELAEWSSEFVNLKEDKETPAPLYKTQFKMLWDKTNLYILLELEEPHIWTYYTTHDQFLYLENALAVLIDKDRSTNSYFGFHVNAQNTRQDFYHSKPPRNGGRERADWSPWGIKNAVQVHGSLNNPSNIDEKWVVEIAVPFKDLVWNTRYSIPIDGEMWKMNFVRINWPTQVLNGTYRKKNIPHSNRMRNSRDYYLYAHNWVWSTHGVANAFYPERWGLVRFLKAPVGSVKETFLLPNEEVLGKYLWLVYYKQQSYRKKNGYYALNLSDLAIPQIVNTDSGEKVLIKQEVRGSYLTITLQTKSKERMTLNQDGFFQVLK